MTGKRAAHPGSPLSGNSPPDTGSSKELDRFLPIANVSRIMKKALPANAKISKEAKETVQECVSEFISFITGEASDKCQREKRKTINGDDLLWAMTTLGFENYVASLKAYLNKYRETEGEKNSMARNDANNEHSPTSSPNNNNYNNNIVGGGAASPGGHFINGSFPKIIGYGGGEAHLLQMSSNNGGGGGVMISMGKAVKGIDGNVQRTAMATTDNLHGIIEW
ncbi:PREDICTED: nuclear transcription factor Y subunit B-1-like [Ipomoea nil]|uniref:nuclear transcription factor Y subunit B-1-like n=1 Tax=Ipomoea nil TaxID=35883 RepID=UPI00090154C5|nr:PREDICTED: nuclear transcription factor Y subunit B-1-like [Ipomoea nil]